jgi:hypothetical protein
VYIHLVERRREAKRRDRARRTKELLAEHQMAVKADLAKIKVRDT